VAQRLDLAACGRALDAGCGTGALALALAAARPGLAVDAVDRDALAVALTGSNARLNSIDTVRSFGSLVLDGRVGGPYDLAVCNLPAKAGTPVLEALLGRLGGLVRPGGHVAVVVVEPLARVVAGVLEALHGPAGPAGPAVPVESTRGHAVFHYAGTGRAQAGEAPAAWMASFVRGVARFEAGGTLYDMTTVYGLPDFDTLSYEDSLGLETLQGLEPRGSWAFWRPGQGHLPASLLRRHQGAADSITLAGRDLLSLEAARVNAVTGGAARERLCSLHLAFYSLLPGAFDFLAVSPDDDPGWRWQRRFAEDAARLVRPGGLLQVRGPSGALARIEGLEADFETLRDKRMRGFRAWVLRRSRA
jgi:16S rRNA G1207 methylase RsmC